MRPRALCTKINMFFIDGYAAGAFLNFQNHVLQGAPERQTLGPSNVPSMISPGGVAFDEFIDILDNSDFSAVFHDGAVVVMQCRFSQEKLTAHRYTYIPCPIDQTILDARPEEIALADWVREIGKDPANQAFRSRGTYRFDYSLDAPLPGSDPHPVSHFTFGSPDCRIPVRAPLSPSDFLSLLFNNFYRPFLSFWQPHAPHLHCVGTNETISSNEKNLHHIHWLSA